MESINQSEKPLARGSFENVAESMSLPGPLRSAHRLAQTQTAPDSFETIARAHHSQSQDYLEQRGWKVTELELLNSYHLAVRYQGFLELRLRRHKEQSRARARKRWGSRDKLHRAALEQFYTLYPQRPDWKTPSGKVRIAAVATELAQRLFRAFSSCFTDPDKKQAGDGLFLYDNFEKTLAQWLRDAIKKTQ